MSQETANELIKTIPYLITAAIALYVALRKTPTEVQKNKADVHKTEAETNNIHAQVADRWAEHVEELEGKIDRMQQGRDEDKKEMAGLRMDIAQVRRENEMYRIQLAERDQVIVALKDWIERLLRQLQRHAPTIQPEVYYAHPYGRLIDNDDITAGAG
jgi:predicted RNase H-like nuclease (RuvC/YqgF family)